MNLIQCFSIEDKEKLIKNGYKFLGNRQLENQVVFLFANNGEKIDFSDCNITFTNKMTF